MHNQASNTRSYFPISKDIFARALRSVAFMEFGMAFFALYTWKWFGRAGGVRYAIIHRIRIQTVAQLFLLNWLPRQPDSWRIWVQQCSYLLLIRTIHASQEYDILANDDIRKFSLWLIFYDQENWRMHQPAKQKPLFRKHNIWPNSKWYGKLPRGK